MNRSPTTVPPPQRWSQPLGVIIGRAPAPLYRQPGILVTHDIFAIGGSRYPIAELSDLHTLRGDRNALTARAGVLAGLVLAAIGTGLSFNDQPTGLGAGTYLVLLLAAVVPVLVAVVASRVRPRPFELWGRYRGLAVQLFISDDERVYGQVTRAVLRAHEAHVGDGLLETWQSSPR